MSGFSKIKFGDGLSVTDEGDGVILVAGGGGTGTGGVDWADTGTGAGAGGSPLTTKGDVWGYSSIDARIPVGADNYVLTADSAQTLGVKWAAAAPVTGGMVKIFDSTLGSDAASIDTGAGVIGGSYGILDIYIYGRSAQVTGASNLWLRVNNDSGTNYNYQRLRGIGASPDAAVSSTAQAGWAPSVPGDSVPANFFGIVHVRIPNYAGTVGYKTAIWNEGYGGTGSNGFTTQFSACWLSTSAISRMSIVVASGANLRAGSRMTIFGIG